MYPLLRPGSFVFIDDRIREVLASHWKHEWERPIYFIALRSGYGRCRCERRVDDLLLIPHPLSSQAHHISRSNEAERNRPRRHANVRGELRIRSKSLSEQNLFTKCNIIER